MRSPAGRRLQKQPEPNDSAELGACEMTLNSNLKGQRTPAGRLLRKQKNALSKSGQLAPLNTLHLTFAALVHSLNAVLDRVLGKGCAGSITFLLGEGGGGALGWAQF